tara:strand:+ start:1292 stop:1483 length:192 start_codon:yes stop_codon:yes gene_type:complete
VNKMGLMSEIHIMLNNGATVKEIADWIFSLKVSRGEIINEDTLEDCYFTAKHFYAQFHYGSGV